MKWLVVCGPSGAGKGTVIDALVKSNPSMYGFSVSHTTRARREGETDGIEYHFCSMEEFERGVLDGDFAEHTIYNGNHYGTSLKAIESLGKKVCVLDLDLPTTKRVRKKFLGTGLFVEIVAPSEEERRRRLEKRGTDGAAAIEERMELGKEFEGSDVKWDAVVVNEDVGKSVEELDRLACARFVFGESELPSFVDDHPELRKSWEQGQRVLAAQTPEERENEDRALDQLFSQVKKIERADPSFWD